METSWLRRNANGDESDDVSGMSVMIGGEHAKYG